MIAAIAVLAVGGAVLRRGPEVAPPFEGEPALVAATFSSDWCTACRVLEPKLAAAIPSFAGAPVKFVALDFTYGERPALRDAAQADGYAALYDRFKGATGFTLLIDPSDGRQIGVLTSGLTEKAIAARIEEALAVTTARDDA